MYWKYNVLGLGELVLFYCLEIRVIFRNHKEEPGSSCPEAFLPRLQQPCAVVGIEMSPPDWPWLPAELVRKAPGSAGKRLGPPVGPGTGVAGEMTAHIPESDIPAFQEKTHERLECKNKLLNNSPLNDEFIKTI